MAGKVEAIELNENDNKLIAFCWNRRRSLSEIAKHLGIAVSNVSKRIERLKTAGYIKEEPGLDKRKVFIRSTHGDKTNEHFVELLKALEENDGEMSQDEFLKQLPFSFGKEEDYDKFGAPMRLIYAYPPLVEHRIAITKHGKRFLREHGKKK